MANLEDRSRDALTRARQANGMTLAELASKSGISASTLSRIETGERRVTVEALERISAALGTSATAVLADATREELLLLPTPRVRLAGGATGVVLRAEEDGRTLLRLTVPERKSLARTYAHPGSEWIHVLRGRLRLRVGDRDVQLDPGHTAQFATTQPHAFGGLGGPAEILSRLEHGAHRS